MSHAFDFSIPLDKKRELLLKVCVTRHIDKLKANTINTILLLRILSILARVHLAEPDEYLNSTVQYTDYLFSKLNISAFPYDENDYKEVDKFKDLREQYNNYIAWLDKQQAADSKEDSNTEWQKNKTETEPTN